MPDFDAIIDRRHSDSEKWNHYDEDVLPLWVADMDFRSPDPVIQALRQRVEHGIFGYGQEPPELRPVIVERLHRFYNWKVDTEALVFFTGVMPGVHTTCWALTEAGDGVLVQPPVYPPILRAHQHKGLVGNQAGLVRCADGRYCVDLDAFERAITDRTRVFILCNPHNPVGRVFRRDELEGMAETCLRHNVIICSDEIHCDIVYPGQRHIPIASLAPEIAQQTVTLIAPSKTFNIPGFHLAVGIIPNEEMRKRIMAMQRPLAGYPGILSFVAALAAYRDCQPWLDEAVAYLQANRDYLFDYVQAYLPGIVMKKPEAMFLAWLDCRQAGIADTSPYDFFLHKARVALSDGAVFGPGGEGFVRLNFGCPRGILAAALERMKQALAGLA